MYAEAYNLDPEFFTFVRSMDVYAKSLGGSHFVLSTDSPFLRYLNDYVEGGDRQAVDLMELSAGRE